MFNMYRNPSMASFSSDGSNFDPTLSTPSLSLTSPDSISSSFRNPASNTISSDFWGGPSSSLGGAGSPTSAGGGGFSGGGGGSANDKPWSSTSIPLVPPMLTNPAAIPSMPEGPALPMKTRNGIVTIFGFSPQQGEPKTKLTVSIGFKQLPGRLIGLRIVFGSGGLRTHVGGGNKKGQWMLRAEVPDVPSATNPSSHILKIEALEGDQVIDNAEFGSFTLWEAGTMPANIPNQSILNRRVRSFENGSVPPLPRPSPYRSSSISSALAAAAAVSAPALTSAQPSSPTPSSSMPTRTAAGILGGNADAYRIVRRTEIPMEREAAALAVTMNIHGDVRSLSTGWTQEEVTARRRLVQFWRVMDGATVNVHFCVIRPEEYDDSRIVVSCIYREDAEKCYITSFDLIRLLEGIIGSVCNIDEKNRIRRNVHHIEHDTISKSKPYHEEFFDLIMSFPAPMPRRNVRDLKAFRWEFLPDALHAIMDKMALDYNPKAVSEMIEPTIPEGDEAMDASMPTFSPTLHAEPERRDSSFSLGDGGGFSFRRPSAMQSALSFDTISPNSSVASFHAHHQSPSASLTNFHLGGGPGGGGGGGGQGGTTTPGQQQHHQQSPNVSVSSFHHHHNIGGAFSQSPNVSVASFHHPAAHHQSPSGSVSSFQAQLASAAFGTSPNSLGGLHPSSSNAGGPTDTPMDLGLGGGGGFGSTQAEIDLKIQDVVKRMQAEQGVIQASKRMMDATSNQDVRRTLELKIREANTSISYFKDTLNQLQNKKAQLERRTSGGTSTPSAGGPSSSSRYDPARGGPSYGRDAYGDSGPSMDPGVPKPKPYTNLDLLKADTPHTTAKISKMYHELEFKLSVEQQYRKATDNMLKLYQADGDKKILQDTRQKQWESNKKIQLLNVALKKYRNLHVIEDDAEDDTPVTPGETHTRDRPENLRKPVSGTLHVTIQEARDLEHAPLSIFKRSSKTGTETNVQLKIEGSTRAQSHPSRTDRWNERFAVPVDKANEVEIGIYDRQPNEQPVPIGFLWIKISDLVEALRKQKFTETGGAWVTAGAMPAGQQQFSPTGDQNAPLMPQSDAFGGAGAAGGESEGITAWFAVEPVGAIMLNLDFVKENVRKRPADAGLGRQGAVRKKNQDEIHEMNGHKFVAHQFYQIMKCAYCAEFLFKGSGYQCNDCRYTCHKECFPKVVTKCISKSNAESEKDEDKINHRIPHRFEPTSSMRPTWCCHCGSMLVGRKIAKQCTECDVTCHADCVHLVPDFCGMSMIAANELLGKIHAIKAQQKSRPQPQHRPSPSRTNVQQPPPPPVEQITSGMGQMNMQDPYRQPPPVVDVKPQPPPPPPPPSYGRPDEAEPDRYDHRQSIVAQQRLPMTQHDRQRMEREEEERRQREEQERYYAQRQQQQQQQQQQPGRKAPPPMYPDAPSMPSPDAYENYGSRPPSGAPPPPPKAYPSPVAAQPDPRYSQQQQQQQQPAAAAPPPPPPQQQQVQQRRSRRKVGLDDFNFLAVLGKGNFGKVMLAEEKRTNGLYAIKVLKKEFIIDNDEVESTRSEKRVFLAAARERHPFLLGLHSCFQTETRVYFVMEYVSGGDLMLHIQRKQFSLRQAKFYAQEVLLALEYFHSQGIIYRDLKLDNILLTLDGHVKVADYGLCKEEMWHGSTTGTFCGTPEFMAPEILLEQKYGKAVDWWAFGVLVYEMLLGQSPFRGDDEDEIFDAILEDEPLYPITMPRDAVSVLQKLLTRDPNRRLGSGKTDAEEIKRHPFFKDTNWDDVVNKRIPPPYFPTITSAADTSNFDSEFTREQPTLTPVHGQLSAQDQSEFQGFSWVANWADI